MPLLLHQQRGIHWACEVSVVTHLIVGLWVREAAAFSHTSQCERTFNNIKHLVQKYAIWNTSYESYVSGLTLASLLADKTQKIIFVRCLCITTLAILFVNAGSLKAKLAKWKRKINRCGAKLYGLIQPYLGVSQRWKVCAANNCVHSLAVQRKLGQGHLSESWHLGLP